MSGNSVERYIDLVKISMTMKNEVEKNKILDEAHTVLRNSKPNTDYIHTGSHNSTMYQTNVYCGPANVSKTCGIQFYGLGYGPPSFGVSPLAHGLNKN